uniref:Right handed beta helix domain-containing protein n=1 Tax=Amphimedon queenslandica TaxID=400682 RepID=A0A1X7TDT8_AMPQE
MSLLLVVVLLFFSSSCSVFSGQYYVSDDCSSVTQSPCNPLSVYAGNMSQYNNTIFYFIGTSAINFTVTMDSVQNITLHGLDQSATILCLNTNAFIAVTTSNHVSFSDLSFQQCNIYFGYSSNITITGSAFKKLRRSNITVTNSQSTGLVIISSVVTVENRLVFKNNTGVVGGGMAIKGSSIVALSPSANLEFIDNHATYKGGGIYIDESSKFKFKQGSSSIPLTIKDNTAGVAGNDIYGQIKHFHQLFNLKIVSTSSDARAFAFCDPDSNETTPIWHNDEQQSVFQGQPLKYNVALFGRTFKTNSYSLTDGRLAIKINGTLVIDKYINNCSLIEYTPNYIIHYGEHDITLIVTTDTSFSTELGISFILNECPIGFSVNSSGLCDCSVSRENVTCDINTLDITHNGLLWIGTYDTSTPFNANETNPNACIINEDCLLYCSPNPVTFQFNDTHTQCVDNRGGRMCGSCTEGYSLLMGSNKCGQCHNNYMMIAWIALFAVMGVLLVVLLIALNLTVSLGTLNGLLFYANIVKSSCSVSSGQYYVSDDCSSVTQSPCNPLSVYARNVSQYNNTIFYFIGTSVINFNFTMDSLQNTTLHGLDQSPTIHCSYYESMTVTTSSHVSFSNLSFQQCFIRFIYSSNITITGSAFKNLRCSNITVTNSQSTGLVIISSVVTVENRLVFKNNTGVVGGGMAIKGSSIVALSPSANLEFIDNHATYKGGGIYFDEMNFCQLIRENDSVSPIPLTLKDNTAGVAGNDIYGQIKYFHQLFNLTIVSTSSDAKAFAFCDPDSNETTPIWHNDDEQQSVFQGQPLKYNVALFGRSSDSNSYSLTDGRLAIKINGTLVIDKYINNCSLIEYTPNYINHYGEHDITLIVTTDTSFSTVLYF